MKTKFKFKKPPDFHITMPKGRTVEERIAELYELADSFFQRLNACHDEESILGGRIADHEIALMHVQNDLEELLPRVSNGTKRNWPGDMPEYVRAGIRRRERTQNFERSLQGKRPLKSRY